MENFSLRAKRTIKKVGALGMGISMLGATISGAFAATLGDYPAPFVSGGKFQNVALIIGDASTNDDNIAVTDLTSGLQKAASTQTPSVTVTGGIEEKVPLGIALTAGSSPVSTGAQLDQDLDDGDIKSLIDSEISWRSSQYDVSEHIFVSSQANLTGFHSSLTSSEDDYKDSVRLEIARTGLEYFYVFDEAINMSGASTATTVNTANPIELNFLGKKLKITTIDSATQFTATIGTEYFLTVGQTAVCNGKTVKILNVASGTSPTTVSIEVDGVQGTISGTNTKTVNGCEIQLQDTFYSDTIAERSANIVMGKTAAKSYKDGDPYIGEPEVNPNWKWSIGGLTSGLSSSVNLTSIATDPTIQTGIKLGAKNYFLRDTASRNALKPGECVNFPNNYVSVCFDRLTVPDTNYMDLKLEFKGVSADLTTSGFAGVPSNAQAIYISTPVAEGLVVDADNTNWLVQNITTEKKTREIYIYTDKADGRHNTSMVFYYDNDIKSLQYAGSLANNTGQAATERSLQFAHVNFDNTKDDDMQLWLNNLNGTAGATTGTFNITLKAREASDFQARENLTMPVGFSGTKINSLGANAGGGTAEGIDLAWIWDVGISGASFTQLGAKDEDHRTAYGVIVKNPTSTGSSDRIELKVPGDLVQGVVKVGGTSSAGGGVVSDTAPTVKKASEVSTLSAFNAVLVGGPCVNSHVAALKGKTYPACGTASGFSENTAVIELQANGANMALIVAGWEAADTKRAGVVLKSWDDLTVKAKLAGKSAVTVTGTTLELTGITVA